MFCHLDDSLSLSFSDFFLFCGTEFCHNFPNSIRISHFTPSVTWNADIIIKCVSEKQRLPKSSTNCHTASGLVDLFVVELCHFVDQKTSTDNNVQKPKRNGFRTPTKSELVRECGNSIADRRLAQCWKNGEVSAERMDIHSTHSHTVLRPEL